MTARPRAAVGARGSAAPRAAVLVAAVLAASAIGHAGAGAGRGVTALVTVADGRAAVATGFAVSPGRVVTVAHALSAPTVMVRGGDGVARRATVVRRDDTLDLALLAVPGIRPAAALAAPGTRMLVRRDGAVAAVSVQILRRIDATVRTAGERGVVRRPALELAATLAPGDSGAPVVSDGRVAGIVFAGSRRRAGVAYAIDAAALARLTR